LPHVAMLLSNPFVSDPRVYAEAKTLVEHGYTVTVIAWDRECCYPPTEEHDRIRVRRIHQRATYGKGVQQIASLFAFWKRARGLLTQEKSDIIHCHDLDTLPVGWLAARRLAAKLIYDSHECYPAMFASHGGLGVLPRTLDWLDRFLSRRVDLIITVGDLLRERFTSMTGCPVLVIGNWKDASDYSYPQSEMAQLAKQLSVKGRLVISFLGQFNVDRVIIPVLEALQDDPDVLFLIAGRGDQQAQIERIANRSPSIRFLGFLPMDQISRYVALSDVAYYGLSPAHPNNDYSVPNALFSALAAGKAILTTDVGEIAQIVDTEQCGIVLSSLDHRTVRAALDQLKDDSKLAAYKHNATRAWAEKYNWHNAQQALLAAYEGLSNAGEARHELS